MSHPQTFEELVARGGSVYTPASPKQKEAYRLQCIEDGSAHLMRDDLNEQQKQYLTRLVRIKKRLLKSNRRITHTYPAMMTRPAQIAYWSQLVINRWIRFRQVPEELKSSVREQLNMFWTQPILPTTMTNMTYKSDPK